MTETQTATSNSQAETQSGEQRSAIEREITLNHQLAAFDYAGIRDNPDLSHEGKIRRFEEAYTRAVEKHQKIIAKGEAQEQARRQELEKEVFSAPQPKARASEGDKSLHYQGLRDALSRAETAHERDMQASAEKKSSSYLSDLLTRAEHMGDEHLAFSCFQIAREKGRETIVNQYLSSRPERQEKYQELRSLGTENADALSLLKRALWQKAPPKPPELLDRNR